MSWNSRTRTANVPFGKRPTFPGSQGSPCGTWHKWLHMEVSSLLGFSKDFPTYSNRIWMVFFPGGKAQILWVFLGDHWCTWASQVISGFFFFKNRARKKYALARSGDLSPTCATHPRSLSECVACHIGNHGPPISIEFIEAPGTNSFQ